MPFSVLILFHNIAFAQFYPITMYKNSGGGGGGDPCAGSPSVGTVCSDGSVYAGLTPDNNRKMFATRCDLGLRWDGTSCTTTGVPGTELRNPTWNNNGSVGWFYDSGLAGTSLTAITSTDARNSGAANTTAIVAAFTGTHAASLCDALSLHSQTDWYLPALREAAVLYTNRTAIGNFSTSTGSQYWVSNQADQMNAYYAEFDSNGRAQTASVNATAATRYARCVRAEALADPCSGTPTRGTVCSDGTMYVGLSDDGNKKMYMERCDEGLTWNSATSTCTGSASTFGWGKATWWPTHTNVSGITDAGSYGTPTSKVYTPTSVYTGKANSSAMATTRWDTATPSPEFHESAVTCETTSDGNYARTDWYLPSVNELNTLLVARLPSYNISNNGTYWTSTEVDATNAVMIQTQNEPTYANFGLSYQTYSKPQVLRVRCVRREP